MGLDPGTRFGVYEIGGQIGAGGMGEVYRATDTALDREVAIKVLPESFAADQDRVARFEREAKTLASLNHANIAQVFGLERIDGTTAIVMELVEGPTLAERIAVGPIPPDEALGIAMQIADALEAAHGAQVVHRDLKPANIKLRPDGTVKVLDFGIAKAIDLQAVSGQPAQMTTPAMTETGVILGTAAYMSPEQARGKLVDQRTDIWAFGCLLFEMLTGQPAFAGEDVMLTLARVLDRDTDLNSIPGTISPAVRHAIALCLKKEPYKRLADIRDVRLALAGELESPFPPSAAEPAGRVGLRAMLVAGGAAIAAAAVAFATFGGGAPTAPPEVRRSVFLVPDAQPMVSLNVPLIGLAPDGRQFAYAAGGTLYLRRLSELEGRRIPGTDNDNPIVPTFSPDGRSIVYGSGSGQLKRIPVEGGTPLPIAEPWPAGGWRWPLEEFVLYGAGEIIGRIPSAGGTPEVLFEQAGYAHYEPRLLPGGDYLLVERRPLDAQDQAEVVLVSLATGERTVLFPGKQAQYLAPGYLVYFDPNIGLMARGFDPATREHGAPITIVDDIAMPSATGGAQFRISHDGDLIYIQGGVAAGGGIVGIAGEDGDIRAFDVPAQDYGFPSVSPDGSQVALQVGGGETANIFLYDVSGGSELRQLTLEGSNRHPAWSPDGEWLTYSSNRDGRWRIYRQRADGSGVAEPLTAAAEGESHIQPVWTPDGERLAYTVQSDGASDIWFVSVPDGTPEVLVGGDAAQSGIAFAPSGEAMAYFAGAGAASEVYAEPFPPDGSRTRISEPGVGSLWPVWSRDGTRLSYQLSNGGFAAVDLTVPGFGVRNRRSLPFNAPPFQRRLDGMPEPDHDEMLVAANRSFAGVGGTGTQIVIVENWVEELKQRLPLE